MNTGMSSPKYQWERNRKRTCVFPSLTDKPDWSLFFPAVVDGVGGISSSDYSVEAEILVKKGSQAKIKVVNHCSKVPSMGWISTDVSAFHLINLRGTLCRLSAMFCNVAVQPTLFKSSRIFFYLWDNLISSFHVFHNFPFLNRRFPSLSQLARLILH